MKRATGTTGLTAARAAVLAAAALATGAALFGTGGAAPGDRALFDGPRGAWLATLRSDAPIVVVEERDGWQRVRLEGWMPATGEPSGAATAPAAPAAVPTPSAPAVAAPPARPAAGAATVSGILLPVRDRAATAGAGLPVLLVGDLDSLDREHSRKAAECRAGLDDRRREIARLREERERALMTIDNFRESVTAGDRLKERIHAAEKRLLEAEAGCRAEAEAVFDRHAVARTVSDTAARFVFSGVPPGRYRVVALDGRSEPPRAWSMECAVEAGETRVVDPRADLSPIDPFWRDGTASRPRS
jgi:hypothetical protein